jgi:hypothetical protein
MQILGTRARVLKPIYRVLIYGVRTEKENIDPSNQAETTEKIRTENATLHPNTNITYVGWLTKSEAKKPASFLVVEFTTKVQADRAIREGLVLGTCHYNYKLYNQGYKLKQYYKCQKYGYIGIQYIANNTCGYYTESHDIRQCKNREEPNFTPKYTLYKGLYIAWSNGYQVRKIQIVKVENTQRNRSIYYGSSKIVVQLLRGPTITEPGLASVESRTGSIQLQTILILSC